VGRLPGDPPASSAPSSCVISKLWLYRTDNGVLLDDWHQQYKLMYTVQRSAGRQGRHDRWQQTAIGNRSSQKDECTRDETAAVRFGVESSVCVDRELHMQSHLARETESGHR